MLGHDFHVTSIFCLHCALYQIRTWKLFDNGKKFCSGKNQKRKKVHGKKEKRKKEKKKTGPKEKVRVPFCQEKKKNSFVKANGTDGAPRWRPDF